MSSVRHLVTRLGQFLSGIGDAIAGLLLAAVNLISSFLPSGSAIGHFTRSRLVWGATALCTFSVVGVLISNSAIEQRRHAAAIEQMALQFRSLRDRSAEEAVWNEFTTQAHERLSALIPELAQAAAANDRTSIDLLWAARDYLPQMLNDARQSPSAAERQFNVCMQRVRRHLDLAKP